MERVVLGRQERIKRPRSGLGDKRYGRFAFSSAIKLGPGFMFGLLSRDSIMEEPDIFSLGLKDRTYDWLVKGRDCLDLNFRSGWKVQKGRGLEVGMVTCCLDPGAV